MRWSWFRRPAPISLGQIEEIVRREVGRQLQLELSTSSVAMLHEDDDIADVPAGRFPPEIRTRKSALLQALDWAVERDDGRRSHRAPIADAIRDEIRRWARLCSGCGQPFLVPYERPGASDPGNPWPSDAKTCSACSTLAP